MNTSEKTKTFKNVKHNVLHLNFPNGNSISSIWGKSTYTENYNYENPKGFAYGYDDFLSSDTVEIMPTCGSKLLKRIQRKYNEGDDNSVIGHVSITAWLEIVNLLAKEKK